MKIKETYEISYFAKPLSEQIADYGHVLSIDEVYRADKMVDSWLALKFYGVVTEREADVIAERIMNWVKWTVK